MEEVEEDVPCYFLCPISLHIMRDPVTLPTGITYDRDGIERWLLTAATCPVTKQPVLAGCDPTPNHTLRRLIQSWCALHKPPAPTTDNGDEALHDVISSEQCLARALLDANDDALVHALQLSNTASREHAAELLLNAVTAVLPTNRLVSLPEQLFTELVQLIRDKQASSRSATKAALHALVATTSWGRNRVKAVDAGAVPVLLDMLFDDGPQDRRACELALAALDRLCGCAEGRHAGGVAAVASKALRVSQVATDKAVRVLRSVARHASTPALLQEMARTGAVATLCLVAQSEQYAERTRERARETLRLHATAWRTSPCLHFQLHHHLRPTMSSYPC